MGATAVLILRTPPALSGARVLRSHGLARPSRISPPPGGADTGGAAASTEGETEAGAGKEQTEFLLLAAGSLGESSEVATAAHARDSSGGVLTAGQVRLPSGRAPRGEGGRGGPRGPL